MIPIVAQVQNGAREAARALQFLNHSAEPWAPTQLESDWSRLWVIRAELRAMAARYAAPSDPPIDDHAPEVSDE